MITGNFSLFWTNNRGSFRRSIFKYPSLNPIGTSNLKNAHLPQKSLKIESLLPHIQNKITLNCSLSLWLFHDSVYVLNDLLSINFYNCFYNKAIRAFTLWRRYFSIGLRKVKKQLLVKISWYLQKQIFRMIILFWVW